MNIAIQWHITDMCDQRCRHCYIFNGADACISTMSYTDMVKTYFKCKAFGKSVRANWIGYSITGGDPILHPDFWKLMELMKADKNQLYIMGNPFHIDENICKDLKSYGCHSYQLSLDGTKETHDWFRKPGSFDETVNKIHCITDAGMNCPVMMTVSDINIDQVLDVAKIAMDAGASIFSFARYVPQPGESNNISPERYRQLLEDYDNMSQKYRDRKMIFGRKDHLWSLYFFEKGKLNNITPGTQLSSCAEGCHCGIGHLTILPNGDVYACRRTHDSKIGNVLTDDLYDIWNGPLEFYRDRSKFKRCSDCLLLDQCRGCPAVASATSGDFYDPDPQCWRVVHRE